MSDTKWCVIRGNAVYGPFDDMNEAFQAIPDEMSMRRVDVQSMRDGEVDL